MFFVVIHGILSIVKTLYEVAMATVTVSSKYQIVIPLEIRKALGIKKGQKLCFVNMGGAIHLVPDRDIREMEGAFPQIGSLDDYRDETDRECGGL
jgi:AbrB family looped-hinge helix DNA binding protein